MTETKKTGWLSAIVGVIVATMTMVFGGGNPPDKPVVVVDPVRVEQVEQAGQAVNDAAVGVNHGEAMSEPEPGSTDAVLIGVGTALDPLTAGMSGAIAGLVVGVGRLFKQVKKRGKAIIEIDDRPDTPRASDQAASREAVETIRDVIAGG